MRIILIVLLGSISLLACKSKKTEKVQEPVNTVPVKDSIVVNPARDSILLQLTNEILAAFKNKDYTALSRLVHPEKGVRFSPYAYVDTASDKILSAAMLLQQSTNQARILWGTADPTGEPIRMTFDAYIKRFVYDVDFLVPEKREVNKVLGGGNTINNISEVYPGADFTESYFSGFEKKYEGMDWKSIRLVYELKAGTYYLVGVVHDEWST